jgi:hypothetical protein
MSGVNALEAYRASKAAEEAAKRGGDSFYVSPSEKKKRIYKPGVAKTPTEQLRIIASVTRINQGKNPFYDRAYFHIFAVPNQGRPGNREYELYCPKKNDGKPCPVCDKEDALKKKGFDRRDEVKAAHGEQAMKDDPQAKAFLREANKYEARGFTVLDVVERARQIEGKKFAFIKDHQRKQGGWDKIEPQIAIMDKDGIDFTDVNEGYDMTLTIVDADRPDGQGTYRAISAATFDRKPSPLGNGGEESARLASDPLEWRQVKKPASVPGYLNADQFLAETAAGRMPIWDEKVPNGKYTGAWVIYPPNGQPFHAFYQNSPEAQAKQNQGAAPVGQPTQMGSPVAAPVPVAPVAPAPVYPAPAPAAPAFTAQPVTPVPATGPTGGTFAYGENDGLPF